MKRARLILWAAVFCAAVFLLAQCELILGESGTGQIAIDLGELFPAESRAPQGVVSYTVTVSGPGMTTVEKTVSQGTRYINMYVPVGPDRTIRLDANLDPAYTASISREHLLSYAGETTVDLYPGKIVMCVFIMREGKMKLIIPDYYRNLLIRIPHMQPTSLTPANWTQFVHSLIYDVAYDASGHIYYVSNNTSVYHINQITDTTPMSYASGLVSGINTITIDNQRNRIYAYGDIGGAGANYVIRYINFTTGAGSISLAPTSLPTNSNVISAIEYESNIFYLARNDTTKAIYRCVLGAGDVIAANPIVSAATPLLRNPRDLLIKGKFLYVTNYPVDSYNYTPTDFASILVFDKNTLALVGSYGTRSNTNNDNRPGYFFGPHHFIAPGNKRIYVIDDDARPSLGRNRIVAFDEIGTWAGWEIFHAEQIPTNPEFQFYSYSFC